MPKGNKVAPAVRRYRCLLLVLLALVLPTLAGCVTEPRRESYQGYVEAEYLMVSSPLSGELRTLAVSRGARVETGTLLFALEDEFETASLAEAEQNVIRAANLLEDLSKGGRPSELAAIEARLEQARTLHGLEEREYERRLALARRQTIPEEELDRARTAKEQSSALVAQLTAELATAGLGARPDAVAAARAELEAARERRRQAGWRLEQKNRTAPQAGLVHDTFFVEGEFVPAGFPVVSLLAPGNLKIRFFVPEPGLAGLAAGQRVSFAYDGAPRPHTATISFISPQAEFTPPVIYSRDTRSRLVYMVEAVPDPEETLILHPGQPVDVRPVDGSPEAFRPEGARPEAARPEVDGG